MSKALRLFLAVVSAGIMAAAYLLPAQTFDLDAASASKFEVSVEPLPLKVSCPGAWVEVGGESGTEIGLIERIEQTSVSLHLGDGEIIRAPEVLVSTVAVAEIAGANQSTELLSAAQAQRVDRARAAGLAASFCSQPATSGWFVNGQSGLGRETVLILSNPNDVDTQIQLELHLPGGVTRDRIALAAGAERLLSLATLSNLESVYALRFESSGQPVSVALQNRYSRGLTPLGVSLSTKHSEPATEQWILPVSQLAEGFEDPILRVFNPGAETQVIATVFGTGGVEVIREYVPEASFLELALPLAGNSAIQIQSDEPVLAAVLNTSLEELDKSWLLPAESFTELRIPLSVYDSKLYLNNPAPTAITVTVMVEDGVNQNYQSFELDAFSMVDLSVSGDSVRIESAGRFQAAVEIIDQGYAVIMPSENRNLGDELTVSVR